MPTAGGNPADNNHNNGGNTMKISELATKELKPGRTLKASSWRAERVDSETRNIYHYSTLMAVVCCGELYQKSEGWGSVSDKRGLSQLRRALAK